MNKKVTLSNFNLECKIKSLIVKAAKELCKIKYNVASDIKVLNSELCNFLM